MVESMSSGRPDDELSRRDFLGKAATLAGAAVIGSQAEAHAKSPEEAMEQFVNFKEKFNEIFQEFQNKAKDVLTKPEGSDGVPAGARQFIEEVLGESSRIKSSLERIARADVKNIDAADRYTREVRQASVVLYFVAKIAKWNDLAGQFDQLHDEIETSLDS